MSDVIQTSKTLPKKRKSANSSAKNEKGSKSSKVEETLFHDDYQHFSLDVIRKKIVNVCKDVPPTDLDVKDHKVIRAWAQKMQAIIEEVNLLLGCVPSAIYRWGSDRSGAADQNIGLLTSELASAQESIGNSVTHRLNNFLAPVVDYVVDKIVITKVGDKEIRTNEYKREVVDVEFSNLCGSILCRNSKMLRQILLANLHKVEKVIKDYEKASQKDNQHDRSLAY